jgi:hypothetical protein
MLRMFRMFEPFIHNRIFLNLVDGGMLHIYIHFHE